MNIVHVIVSMDLATGGPPVVASRLAIAQAGLGNEVSLLTYAVDTDAAPQPFELPLAGTERVRLHSLAAPTAWQNLTGRAVAHWLRGQPQPDIVHLHGVWDPMLRAAASVTLDRGGKYCLAPHGMLDPWSLRQRRWKKRLALAMGYRGMLDHAAFLHLLNRDESRLIEPLGLTAPRVVIPNGVFLDEIDPLPARGTFRAAHRAIGDRPFVLFLSRLHYKKGLDYLADAFEIFAKQQPEPHLVVAGPDGGAQPGFEKAIAAKGLAERVHVVGPLYGRDKLAAMVDASCFCLPSRQEGFSIAITEALACGLPVVISDACHFPEVAQASAGEVVPLDAGAIAAALGRVLDDPDLAKRMGEAGRALIQTRYTWPKIAEQTVALYRQYAAAM